MTSFLRHPVETFAYQFLISDRIGIAKGKILVPKDFDRGNEEIMRLMTGGDL